MTNNYQPADFEVTDNTTSNSLSIADQECLYVKVNDRVKLCIQADDDGNVHIGVWPITDGEIWDAPFEEFDVDIDGINQAEKELRDNG